MLVMTILVRDEIDIIKDNLDHHLNYNVDFIIATDNGSVDGTREILLDYEKQGILKLIDEPIQDYSQSKWVNRMGHMAFNDYKATHMFHIDADEFWYAKSGSLTEEIDSRNLDSLTVKGFTVLLYDLGGIETYPHNMNWVVIKNLNDIFPGRKYIYTVMDKVFLSNRKTVIDVSMGNHLTTTPNIQQGDSLDLSILHYPIRGKEQFFQKVRNGGKSYEDNKELPYGVGWHWRDWYEEYKRGTLIDSYKKFLIDPKRLEELQTHGAVISKSKYIRMVKYPEKNHG